MRTTHHVRDSFAHNADHLAHDTPLSAFVAGVVCTSGATPPRTATSPPRTATSPPPNGGNCTIRGVTRRRHAVARLLMVQNPHPQRCDVLRKGQRARAGPGAACFPTTPPANGGNCTNRATTRRRHADRMLLMVQNPHHYPWCHAPTLVSCSLTVVTLSHWCGAARRDADKRQKGVTDRTVAGERATNSTTGLVPIRQNTPSVIIQPVLIGRNALDQVESSLTGRMPPNGSKAPDQESSSRWCASCLRRCGVSVLARHSSLDDARDRAATNTL